MASSLAPDLVVKASAGEPADLWVYSSYPKGHWVARTEGDLRHAEHPGTALMMGEEIYEVRVAEAAARPGYVLRYGLKKWESSHALRHTVVYNPETQAQAAAQYQQEATSQALRQWVLGLFPFAGLGPNAVQRDWEARSGVNMTLVAAASALTEVLVFMALVQFFHGAHLSQTAEGALDYLGLDGAARLFLIVFTGSPRGIFVLNLPYVLWERIFHPERRAARLGRRGGPAGLDEVIRPPGSPRLTIRSEFFDDLLLGPQPVRFEGAVYKFLDWHQEGRGLRRRWVYEFEKTDLDPKGSYRDYTRPRAPQRQKAVEELTRRHDRVASWAILFGMYSGSQQARLETRYGHPARQMTSATAGLLLGGAALEAWLLHLFHTPAAVQWIPAYFVPESLYRLFRARAQGQPAGSVLGLLLGFFLPAPR